jgi:hypothetical protein
MAFLSSSCESICTCDMHSCLLQVACFFVTLAIRNLTPVIFLC